MNPWAFCADCQHIGVSHAITGACVLCACRTFTEEDA